MSKKRKKRSKRQILMKKLDVAWAKAVKERDEYTCQYCGKKATGSGMHASHVTPKSFGNRLRWQVVNGKALCSFCHLRRWHYDPVEMGAWFKEKFPDRWEYIEEQRALGHVKFTDCDLEDILEEFENSCD